MDLPQLAQLYALTLNTDPNIRKKAELDIIKVRPLARRRVERRAEYPA